MPKQIETEKKRNPQPDFNDRPIDTTCFSEKQSLAYNIVLNHACRKSTEPLLLIISGEAGTGKSYLINAVLPIFPTAHKDLSGQSLVVLQESLVGIEYIIIDEYSMLGQTQWDGLTAGVDKQLDLKQEIFGMY